MDKIIICDIDGTIAKKHPDRDIYDFTKCGWDIPIYETLGVLDKLTMYREDANTVIDRILFITGRMEIARNDTVKWIYNNVSIDYSNCCSYELFMRKDGDTRPDEIIKHEIYETHIKDKYDIFAVFDDRPKVIRMWRELGLFVFDCNQTGIEF